MSHTTAAVGTGIRILSSDQTSPIGDACHLTVVVDSDRLALAGEDPLGPPSCPSSSRWKSEPLSVNMMA